MGSFAFFFFFFFYFLDNFCLRHSFLTLEAAKSYSIGLLTQQISSDVHFFFSHSATCILQWSPGQIRQKKHVSHIKF